ncbi:hypothetical protein EYZ11_008483 [Aspergillus tanneri]|uniref:Uncharacterized protein n=1 Tax=Aspergillus tanneri TaxID=1220188 RepID=A0A4S3JAS4_9EURO|nr:hypothetical protein EYZ11_008483 [Aspergillus tanneri]
MLSTYRSDYAYIQVFRTGELVNFLPSPCWDTIDLIVFLSQLVHLPPVLIGTFGGWALEKLITLQYIHNGTR